MHSISSRAVCLRDCLRSCMILHPYDAVEIAIVTAEPCSGERDCLDWGVTKSDTMVAAEHLAQSD